MDRFKKISTKVFKKSPTPLPPYVPPKPALSRRVLKRSPSVQNHPSGTAENTRTSKPFYKGARRLKPSDIHIVLDISEKGSRGPWETAASQEYEQQQYDNSHGDNKASTPHSPAIPMHMLEQFPSPPDTNAFSTPRVPPDPRTYTHTRHRYLTDADLLDQPLDPYLHRLQRERDRQKVLEQANRPNRQPTVQRSSSSSSSYSRPTQNAYPGLTHSDTHPTDTRPPLSHRHRTLSNVRQPSSQHQQHQEYYTTHANMSMYDFGPRTRLVDRPVVHRPVIRQASTPVIHHPQYGPIRPLPTPPHHPHHADARRATHDTEKTERVRLRSSPAQYMGNENNGNGYDGYNAYEGSHHYSNTGSLNRAPAINRSGRRRDRG